MTTPAEPDFRKIMIMKPKFCFISPIGTHSGSDLCLTELVRELARSGYASHVIAPVDDYVTRTCAEIGVTTSITPVPRWATSHWSPRWRRWSIEVLHHLAAARRIARLIKQSAANIVVTNTLVSGAGALAARLARKPHLTHVHEFGDLDHGLNFSYGADRQMRWLCKHSRACIFNSSATYQRYRKSVGKCPHRIVHYGVDVPASFLDMADQYKATQPAAPFRCVTVGTRIETKGSHLAVEAIRILRDRNRPVMLTIVGEGPPKYRQRLETAISTNQLGDLVHIAGSVSPPYPLQMEAHLSLTCSKHEAFGRVTVEAMKLGTPVIASRSGGTGDIISDGHDGLLFEPNNAIDLADKIQVLYDDRSRLAAMSRAAVATSRGRFSNERYVERFLDAAALALA